jgi:hypothetical protein
MEIITGMELTFKDPDDNFADFEPVYDNTSSEAFDEDMGGLYASNCEPQDHESIPFTPDVSLQARALSRWLILFFLRLQAAYHLSDAALSCILRFIAAFLVVLSNISSHL